ncbi:protein takeout-like [Drosophila takahashii]|uniref:protein takeout-like n=1 Tax=Drosophila takahashii TaxID=29030 RepID=UPI001CF80E04|nr:circadian clock-controlled protein daywake-like [Drosophila takahashii]
MSLRFAILTLLSAVGELPVDVKKCRFGNETCLIESLNGYIRAFAKGYPKLDYRPFDKLPISDLVVYNSSQNLPVWMTFSVRNQVLKGLENATVLSVKGFNRDPTKTMIIIGVRIP